MNNEYIVKSFNLLHKYYAKNKDTFRARAYKNAAESIKKLPEITDMNQVKNVKGIGKTLKAKIKEYLDSGKISKAEAVKDEINEIHPFEKIFGVGPVKSKKLQGMGFKTISDLEKNPNVLTSQQKIGLKYYYELLGKIPRIKIRALEVIIRYVINKEFGKSNYTMDIAGSYRRGKLYSGDIDILITSTKFDLNDLVKLLIKYNIITDTLSMKSTKFMGITICPGQEKPHHRLDIEFLPKQEYPSGLLYFTGSKEFNIKIRSHAKKLGFVLNEHGLFKKGNRVNIKTEEDLFKKLSLMYIPPENR